MATRTDFHDQLAALQHDLLQMGLLVEEAIDKAVRSLKEADVELAEQVQHEDDRIDQMMLAIESRCLEMIALQQPLARDLRVVGTALKVITDLERMADHAVNIARTTIRLAGAPLIKPLVDIPRMAEMASAMTREALMAFVDRDVARAEGLFARDHEMDALYRAVFVELEGMMGRNPGVVQQALQLLLVARDLERVGDHATNLGEWVIYMVTGQRRSLND